jgi:cell division protein FtsI (penicillin-binding protein 3)
MSTTSETSFRRLVIIRSLIVIWVLVIGAKLASLQIHKHETLLARAQRQQRAEIDLCPIRGIIYDRNGNELARSVEVRSLYAAPSEIGPPDTAASELATALKVDRDDLLARLTSDKVLVAVKRKLSDDELRRVEALALPGLHYVDEMKRYYVSGQTAAHVLGFVDVEERGKGGVELTYDSHIAGTAGRLILSLDAVKRSYDHLVQSSTPGQNVTLTIDSVIQRHVEGALAEAVRSTGSRGGTVVVVRPATGEVLALANYPTYDPNNLSESTEASRHDYAIESAYEPGSVFKLVTYAAALEESLIRPDTLIDCGGGKIEVAGRTVSDHHFGVLTASQALAKSSNVAAIKIGMRLGNERLARYIDAFGFGRRTGIELPGESRGLVRPATDWEPTSIGSIPIGHEIGVTALQAVSAYACIANGGVWVQPHLINNVTTPSGEVIETTRAEGRRVVSDATAATLRDMLEGVVVYGTGKRARLGGYRAAGKTGTAQKIDKTTGRYSKTRYIATFAGFAPVENPEIACIVSLDEPRGAHQGGQAAAPVFARVVSEALEILGVPADDEPRVDLVAGDYQVYDVPARVAPAPPESEMGEDDPRPMLEVTTDAFAPNSEDSASKRYGSVTVPNLAGRGIRDAVALCSELRLRIRPSGEGVVMNQSPPPGTMVAEDTVCYVRLSRMVITGGVPGAAGRKAGGRDTVPTSVTVRTN